MATTITMCAGSYIAHAGYEKACADYSQDYGVFKQIDNILSFGFPRMEFSFSDQAREKSTCFIKVKFFDENNYPVVPNSITWKLSDDAGAVINSRTSEVMTPATEIDIVLTGDDLEIISGNKSRVLLVQAPYDSSLGDGLANNEECSFEILDLINIS